VATRLATPSLLSSRHGCPSYRSPPHLLICIISFPFPFLIRFDVSSVVCVPWSFSWSNASCSIVGAVVTARCIGQGSTLQPRIRLQNVDWGDGHAVAAQSTDGLLCTRTTGSWSSVFICW